MARKYKRDSAGRFAGGGGFGTNMKSAIGRGVKSKTFRDIHQSVAIGAVIGGKRGAAQFGLAAAGLSVARKMRS